MQVDVVIHLNKHAHDEGDHTWCGAYFTYDLDEDVVSGHPGDVNCGLCLFNAMDFYEQVEVRYGELLDADA